ncbi:hypothetical protein RJ640_001204 [Escallonia rubra]|uniref:Ubiquinone biosynthesis O-methyltransferase, mitochondrial n=1 Tax=Escallonia rubra TaxID=112253 RepID=A0AA88UJE2_9ASTE|nr:hypothetical protein RJ640_001204 [Escallonia rubra]
MKPLVELMADLRSDMVDKWDAEGPFKPLHLMNPTRLAFIRSTLCRHFSCTTWELYRHLDSITIDIADSSPLYFPRLIPPCLSGTALADGLPKVFRLLLTITRPIMNQTDHASLAFGHKCLTLARVKRSDLSAKACVIADPLKGDISLKDPNCARPFEGLKFVDVGCGGGILSEPLARMGATVTGIDAIEKNIKIARLHADLDPITSSIDYRCTTAAENLVEERGEFDAVFGLEVIEHVADPADFCKSLAELTVFEGATIISTINRSMRSYAAAIVAAEYILYWLPRGTHQWSSFLTPEELVLILQRASISVQEMAGFVYNPLTGRWSLCDDVGVNYIAFGTKNSQ